MQSETAYLHNSEWRTNQIRDSNAAYIGHFSMLSLFSVVENESIGRVRYNLLQVSIFVGDVFVRNPSSCLLPTRA